LDRAVLGGGGDDRAPAGGRRVERAADRHVDGLGAAGGEDDLDGLGADELGDGAARELDLLARRLPRAMDGRGVVPADGERVVHRAHDVVERAGRRVVVEVDHRGARRRETASGQTHAAHDSRVPYPDCRLAVYSPCSILRTPTSMIRAMTSRTWAPFWSRAWLGTPSGATMP